MVHGAVIIMPTLVSVLCLSLPSLHPFVFYEIFLLLVIMSVGGTPSELRFVAKQIRGQPSYCDIHVAVVHHSRRLMVLENGCTQSVGCSKCGTMLADSTRSEIAW